MEEIIGEIILRAFAAIFEFVFELLLQLVFEALADYLGHSIKAPFRRGHPVQPWLAVMGYSLYGAAAGALSLWLIPVFIKTQWLRVASLVLVPIAAGLIMHAIGNWRGKRDKEVIRLERFTYGFCFAFTMAVVRYTFGG